MKSKRTFLSGTSHRLPRKGLSFLFIRFVGLLLKVAGLLLCGIAVIGFFIVLVKIGPTIIESIRYLDEQKMAGLIFLTGLVSLLAFPAIGFLGVVTAVLGFALGYIGTEPAASTSKIDPYQERSDQIEKPPAK